MCMWKHNFTLSDKYKMYKTIIQNYKTHTNSTITCMHTVYNTNQVIYLNDAHYMIMVHQYNSKCTVMCLSTCKLLENLNCAIRFGSVQLHGTCTYTYMQLQTTYVA